MLLTHRLYPDTVRTDTLQENRLLSLEIVTPGQNVVPQIVEDLKAHEDDRDRIERVAMAAKEIVEEMTGYALDKQTIRCVWEAPGVSVRIPRGPVREITSLVQIVEGVEAALTVSDFYTSPGWRRVQLRRVGGGSLQGEIIASAPVYLRGVFEVGAEDGKSNQRLMEAVKQCTANYAEQVGSRAYGIQVTEIKNHLRTLLREDMILPA